MEETMSIVTENEVLKIKELVENGFNPYLVWQGKLYAGKLKFETLRIYLEKIVCEEKKSKIHYIKFLELFTELVSGKGTEELGSEEVLNLPKWTRLVKHQLVEKPLVWNKKNEVDYFIERGKQIPEEVLIKALSILSSPPDCGDPLSIRNYIKEILEDSGLSCDIEVDVTIIKKKETEE